MKTKGLLMTNGIVGLIGGVLLLLGPFLLTGGAVSDIAGGTSGSTSGVSTVLTLVKIAVLALGIIGLVYYKGDTRVKQAPDVLLVVGGGVALIPFLGWAGGIVVIVGGALALAGLKAFNAPQQ